VVPARDDRRRRILCSSARPQRKEERGSHCAGGIHDGSNVVHPLLWIGIAGDCAIGWFPFIEPHQPTKGTSSSGCIEPVQRALRRSEEGPRMSSRSRSHKAAADA